MTFCFPYFSRPHLGSVSDFRFPVADGPADASSSSAVLRRPQKVRVAALRDEPSKARASVLAARELPALGRVSCSSRDFETLGIPMVIGRLLSSPPPIFLFLAKSFVLGMLFSEEQVLIEYDLLLSAT